MSLPTFSGLVSIMNPTTQPLSLRARSWSGDTPLALLGATKPVATLPSATTNFGLYSWSIMAGFECSLTDPGGAILYDGYLRPGGVGQANLAHPIDLSVSFDTSSYPGAASLMIVPNASHQPDPTSAHGSVLSYYKVRKAAVRQDVIADGVSAITLHDVQRAGHTIQLWGYGSGSTSLRVKLLSSAPLPATSGSHGVSLP
jgi:hypothetical protein